MLLSIQQKYILEVLRKLGCIRRQQLAVLVRETFRRPDMEISDARLNTMLRQLRAGSNSIRIDGEIISQPNVLPDALLLEAVDVMLELAEGKPGDFSKWLESPGLLRFSWGENLRLFTIAALSVPMRPTVELLAQRKHVVWIASNGVPCQQGSVPEGLTLPSKHFFAARLPDGSHRFYGSNGP